MFMARARTRWLIAAVAVLATLVMTFVSAPSLRVAQADSNRPQTYLALGDSVAFGMNPLVDPTNASNFVGYPTPVAAALKESLTNAACPGESSGHFLSLSAPDNGCEGWRFYLNYPLHVSYDTTQMQFADSYLKSHPKTLVVSIDMGANDLFVLEHSCNEAVACILAGLPNMLTTLGANLNTIYSHIRTLDDYHHKLVALTYYSTDYSDTTTTYVISQVNQVVAQRTLAWGGVVADGFGAFAAASTPYGGDTCAAHLRIPLPTGGCDLHPSVAGRNLLAQAIVNALRPD
jgi:hypothetical protein